MLLVSIPILLVLLGVTAFLGWQIRKRHMGRWLAGYFRHALRRAWRRRPTAGGARREEEVHLILCVADHYEPKDGGVPPEVARGRVQAWVEGYPRQFGAFRDSDGRTPRHTFFYPAEEYEPEYLDALAELCAAGFGEVEVHLHHDRDTPERLRQTLETFRTQLVERHGLLSRNRHTGEVAYAFIHGNWSLCNPFPDGWHCGVNNELEILRGTGCCVDMTMPSAPSPTQTRKVNSIYYAVDVPGRPRSNDSGVDVGTAPRPAGSLLLIQGPLTLDWGRRKWGLLPRVENGCLQPSQPPSVRRVPLWLRAGVQVPARPDWYFVKLHCHGAAESSQEVLLGQAMVRFHEELAEYARARPNFHYHYVTAREMYNLVKAAEAGWTGSVIDALDHEVICNIPAVSQKPEAQARDLLSSAER
jgi:hypothetical protein